jgi:hypothetical protein
MKDAKGIAATERASYIGMNGDSVGRMNRIFRMKSPILGMEKHEGANGVMKYEFAGID